MSPIRNIWLTQLPKKYTILYKNAYLLENKMTKVTAKYQITIPPAVRNELGIVPGSRVEIAKKGNDFVIVVDPIGQLKKNWRGRCKGTETTDEYMNVVRGSAE